MSATIARIFRNGRNQAVRIPVELSLDADEVEIAKVGEELVLRPLPRRGWDRFFAREDMVLPEEFDTGEDPPPQPRSPLL